MGLLVPSSKTLILDRTSGEGSLQKEATFLFCAENRRVRQNDEAACFIGNAIIDCGYIDKHNTDITF